MKMEEQEVTLDYKYPEGSKNIYSLLNWSTTKIFLNGVETSNIFFS